MKTKQTVKTTTTNFIDLLDFLVTEKPELAGITTPVAVKVNCGYPYFVFGHLWIKTMKGEYGIFIWNPNKKKLIHTCSISFPVDEAGIKSRTVFYNVTNSMSKETALDKIQEKLHTFHICLHPETEPYFIKTENGSLVSMNPDTMYECTAESKGAIFKGLSEKVKLTVKTVYDENDFALDSLKFYRKGLVNLGYVGKNLRKIK